VADGNCQCKRVQMARAANTLCWKGWTFIPGPLESGFLRVLLNSAWVQAARKTLWSSPVPLTVCTRRMGRSSKENHGSL